MNLQETFGAIDIYVFDQLLRGRLPSGARILDVGCGSGRNLVYFLRNGYPVCGIDTSPEAIDQVQRLAAQLAPQISAYNFRVASVTALPFPAASFDAVLCIAVLHFARDEEQFEQMVAEMWRALAPGGLFFARLASTIGFESRVVPIQGRWHALPDGTDRFLVDEALLVSISKKLGGIWLDPLKTTNVQNQRCMTTWVLQKPAAHSP